MPNAQRVLDFACSEVFERTFKEGMALVEETAAYLDGPGRAAAKQLNRAAALAYAGESMRLTTRLMQVASWLLVQRAVRDRQIALTDAAGEKYRLVSRAEAPAVKLTGVEDLPGELRALAMRGEAIFERVRRLDQSMYGAEGPAENTVGDQWARLTAVFGAD